MLLAVFVVALAISIAVLYNNKVITGDKIKLGTIGYDIEPVVSPAATGPMLNFLAYMISDSILGPSIRRYLLKQNGIDNLRELSAQINLPPMHYPMRRISNVDYSYDITDDFNSLLNYANENYLNFNTRRSVVDFAKAYRNGVKPSDVMQRTINQIEEWKTQKFLVFSSFHPDVVMEQAHASDRRFAEGKPLSVLDGVPIAVKDMVDVKGHIARDGKNPDPRFKDIWSVSAEDDVVIARLRSQGAIILGLTIMTEGGVTPLGYSAQFQGPLNPYNPNRYSGGSSSGSAVAVSSGLVPIAIGFDGGGSIRIPSSLSGTHGLGGTFGRFPFHRSSESSMIKCGPMTSTAIDAAVTYAYMAPSLPGHFYTDMYGAATPPPSLKDVLNIDQLSDVRIGIYNEWFDDSQPEIRERCREVVKFLESKGAKVVPISIPHLRWMSLSHGFQIISDFAMLWDKVYNTHRESMEPNTKITVALGNSVTALEALAADRIRAWAFNMTTELYKTHQLTAIVNPTVGIEQPVLTESAKLFGESNTALVVQTMKYIFLGNFLGLPGYSVPVGYLNREDDSKLPIGFHMLGDHWGEPALIRMALAIEKQFMKGDKFQRPKYFFDPLQQ